MLEIKYNFELEETTQVTLDFLENRPILKVLILLMKIACFLVFIGFAFQFMFGQITIFNVLVVLFALIWIVYRREINYFLLKKSLQKNKINEGNIEIHILKHKLWWRGKTILQDEQPWKKVKKIYKNNKGFIVPLVGISSGAKFIWLPNKGFEKEDDLQEFLKLIEDKNIKITEL